MTTAHVYGGDDRQVAAYLPENYKVFGEFHPDDKTQKGYVIIKGEDRAGWTMVDYVQPRLASGLMRCEVVAEPECKHEHTDFTPADRSVGQYEALMCEDCGEDLTDTVLVELREAADEARAERIWEMS